MKPQLTIEAFADWCEKQPADKSYDYWSMHECAYGQYAAFLGMKLEGSRRRFWWEANCYAVPTPWNFGALAKRLRAQPA